MNKLQLNTCECRCFLDLAGHFSLGIWSYTWASVETWTWLRLTTKDTCHPTWNLEPIPPYYVHSISFGTYTHPWYLGKYSKINLRVLLRTHYIFEDTAHNEPGPARSRSGPNLPAGLFASSQMSSESAGSLLGDWVWMDNSWGLLFLIDPFSCLFLYLWWEVVYNHLSYLWLALEKLYICLVNSEAGLLLADTGALWLSQPPVVPETLSQHFLFCKCCVSSSLRAGPVSLLLGVFIFPLLVLYIFSPQANVNLEWLLFSPLSTCLIPFLLFYWKEVSPIPPLPSKKKKNAAQKNKDIILTFNLEFKIISIL